MNNETASPVGDAAAMREALEHVEKLAREFAAGNYYVSDFPKMLLNAIRPALAKPLRTGKWKNGRNYEYEFAYCSACGRMQWADWDSHEQAKEKVKSFADDYRFCPGCGARMEGGVYVK